MKEQSKGLQFSLEKLLNEVSCKSAGEYLVIYSGSNPKWCIPSDHRLKLFTLLLNWSPFSLRGQLFWNLFISAYLLRICFFFPRVIRRVIISSPDQSDLLPVVYIGTPSSTQKIVLFLCDHRTGKPCKIVKFPLALLANDQIKNEANVLQFLMNCQPKLTPKLFSYDNVSGISVQEPCSGRHSSSRFDYGHLNYLVSLVHPQKTINIHSELINLLNFIKSSAHTHPYVIDRVIAMLAEDLLKKDLPSVIEHGDFVPWNILRSRRNIIAVDWEFSRLNGVPMMDFFDFLYIQKYCFNTHWDSNNQYRNLQFAAHYLKALHIDVDYLPHLFSYYLMQKYAKSLSLDNFQFANFISYQLSTDMFWQL